MIKETDDREGDTIKAEKENPGAKIELTFVCKETVSVQQKQNQ
jgi:hypothetical protein